MRQVLVPIVTLVNDKGHRVVVNAGEQEAGFRAQGYTDPSKVKPVKPKAEPPAE